MKRVTTSDVASRSAPGVTDPRKPVIERRHHERQQATIATHKPAQIEKARELIADGGIVEVRRGRNSVFRVIASNGVDRYLTAAQACTCKAGLVGRFVCYHRIAAQLIAA